MVESRLNEKEDYSVWQELRSKAKEELIPIIITLELTYRCNLRCKHCYVEFDKGGEELTISELDGLLDELKEMGTFLLILTGGEIFLREDIKDILIMIKQKGFAQRIFSNGTLFDNSWYDFFDDLQPERFEISMYGSNPEVHDSITGKAGSFDRTANAVRELSSRGHEVVVKTVWMKDNYRDFVNWMNMVEELTEAVPLWTSIIAPLDNGSFSNRKYILTNEQIKELRDTQLEYFKNKYGEEYKIDDSTPCDIQIPSIPCSAGFSYAGISPDGCVYPCIQIRLKAGNIREESFRKIWNDSKIMNFIRDLSNNPIDECSKCMYNKKCMRCPGISWLESGSLSVANWQFCRQVRI